MKIRSGQSEGTIAGGHKMCELWNACIKGQEGKERRRLILKSSEEESGEAVKVIANPCINRTDFKST